MDDDMSFSIGDLLEADIYRTQLTEQLHRGLDKADAAQFADLAPRIPLDSWARLLREREERAAVVRRGEQP